jgi:hypothetical protein
VRRSRTAVSSPILYGTVIEPIVIILAALSLRNCTIFPLSR